MKRIKNIQNVATCLLSGIMLLLLTPSCSNDDVTDDVMAEQTSAATEMRTTMKLHADITPFDANSRTTRADYNWTKGTTVFLQFKSGTSTVCGHATYNGNDEWDATFNGSIATSGKCEVYYFEGAATTSMEFVKLTNATPLYADTLASFSLSGQEISITANLKPMTSRLRMKGSSGTKTTLGGLTTYTGYDVLANKFVVSTSDIELTVGSDGYTPYVYCMYTSQDRKLSLFNSIDGNGARFEKTFDSSVLKQGESGYMTIPTISSNRGWKIGMVNLDFEIKGNNKTAKFTMVYVAPGRFDMGDTFFSYTQPIHSVTLTKAYYMGQTEVTQALWIAVMGSNSSFTSSYGLGDNYPAYSISWERCQTFINNLNTKLSTVLQGKKFRMPTEAEWEFAARGGNSSKGYTYSGSNTVGNVAWYNSNASGKTHVVKNKSANELGLYDMSGNVYEWCQDWYTDYPSSDQNNPSGPATGTQRVRRGGSYDEVDASSRVSKRGSSEPTSSASWIGLRLVLQ